MTEENELSASPPPVSDLRVIILISEQGPSGPVRSAILKACEAEDVRPALLPLVADRQRSTSNRILTADLIIAEGSSADPQLFYRLGEASVLGKIVHVLLNRTVQLPVQLYALLQADISVYDNSPDGLSQIVRRLRSFIKDIKKRPPEARIVSGPLPGLASLSPRDIRRLPAHVFENLCFELLRNMNFRDLRWIRRPPEIDLAATLSRTDPDGFSYEELWFVSMKRDVTEEDLARIATVAPEPLLIQMQRRARGAQGAQADSSTLGGVTLLLMSRDAQRRPQFRNEQMRTELFENRSSRNIRIRVWDEGQLAVLLRRYPSLAFKYFLDQEERPFDARHRKTSGDFYRENTLLNTRLQETLRKLEEETERRTRAEREAVWKDLSFQAAHRLGNPIFAIETDLQNLKGKLSAKASGTRSLVNEMKGSVEKAKAIIQQFKSLMAAQELTFGPVALPRIVEDACRVARDQGVAVTTQVAADIPQLSGDLSKLAGCFDELIANALHFLSEKDAQTIDVEILAVQKGQLPTELDGSKTYLLVRMADNGSGIPLERKHEIFRPFFTTYAQGAGLGLALVETVVVGHGGMVREVGEPEKGAVFEVFLPVGQ